MRYTNISENSPAQNQKDIKSQLKLSPVSRPKGI